MAPNKGQKLLLFFIRFQSIQLKGYSRIKKYSSIEHFLNIYEWQMSISFDNHLKNYESSTHRIKMDSLQKPQNSFKKKSDKKITKFD